MLTLSLNSSDSMTSNTSLLIVKNKLNLLLIHKIYQIQPRTLKPKILKLLYPKP